MLLWTQAGTPSAPLRIKRMPSFSVTRSEAVLAVSVKAQIRVNPS